MSAFITLGMDRWHNVRGEENDCAYLEEVARFFVKGGNLGLDLAVGIIDLKDDEACYEASNFIGGCALKTSIMSGVSTGLSIIDTIIDFYKGNKFHRTVEEIKGIWDRGLDVEKQLSVCQKLVAGLFFGEDKPQPTWRKYYRAVTKTAVISLTIGTFVNSLIAKISDDEESVENALNISKQLALAGVSVKFTNWVLDVIFYNHTILKKIKKKIQGMRQTKYHTR